MSEAIKGDLMKKLSTIFGFISLILAVMSSFITLSYFLGGTSGDWASLGLMLFAIIFVILTIVLTIPFLITLFTVKIQNMKFHFLSHIALIVMSAIMLIVGMNA
jgi:hypothetical protein